MATELATGTHSMLLAFVPDLQICHSGLLLVGTNGPPAQA